MYAKASARHAYRYSYTSVPKAMETVHVCVAKERTTAVESQNVLCTVKLRLQAFRFKRYRSITGALHNRCCIHVLLCIDSQLKVLCLSEAVHEVAVQ